MLLLLLMHSIDKKNCNRITRFRILVWLPKFGPVRKHPISKTINDLSLYRQNLTCTCCYRLIAADNKQFQRWAAVCIDHAINSISWPHSDKNLGWKRDKSHWSEKKHNNEINNHRWFSTWEQFWTEWWIVDPLNVRLLWKTKSVSHDVFITR